jgi:hypothetical protein
MAGSSALAQERLRPAIDSLNQRIAALGAKLDSLETGRCPVGQVEAVTRPPTGDPVVDSLAASVTRLEGRVIRLTAAQCAALAAGAPAPDSVEDELEALRRAARAAAGEEPRDSTTQQGSRTRGLQALNPEISVTGDIVGNWTAPSGEPDQVSATPREFEFSFQAALDPFARTKIFVTREEDFEIAGFPEEEEEEHEGGFEIEEGYLYWVALPGGFGAKLGKFRQEIGLYNRWHTHALQEVERPLAAITFLGEDGLIQTGAGITLPTFTIGRATQTVNFEVARGSNSALFEEGRELSYLGRAQSFWDLGTSSLEFGATGLYGENDNEALSSKLLGIDLAYRWAPAGRALYRGVQVKGEWYFVGREEAGAETSGDGGYLQASVRLSRRWIVGARADYVNPFDGEPNLVQLAPSLTWWQSEWVRLRLQYNYLKPDGGSGNHTLLLQSVWAIGPHKHETY